MSVVYFIFQQTMYFMIPLMIVALGAMFSERSGIINIALEGIMTMGAFTGILFIHFTGGSMNGQFQLIVAVLISMVTGMVFSLFHAYASINMKSNQVISGTALNMFAPAFAIFVARVIQGVQQVQFNNTFRITSVPFLGKIPFFGPLLFQNAYITTYIGIAIFLLSTIVLYKTRFGLRLRSCGEHPQAADSAGINVYRMQYAGVMISGALGGLGGLVFVVPTSTNFNADVAGYGFLALAVLIFGQWKPVNIMLASLFFGLMKAIASAYSGIPFLSSLGIPSYFYKMVPYIITLIVLIFTSRNSQAPKAEGIPYDKGQR
ncbi:MULTISPECIES: ABC transporter permease [Clostridia]|uniref:Sugar ABC transporter permease n=1 Tax=Lacrimispora celerecrescens TaxID=29354 RepID=A0A084JM34_9FIRM|nr:MULTISPECIES: ABC transporter permease [Clostridia]KEZ90018.1 sugar ABC transporter permease [Lacrimispora celerecrescens]MBW4847026.1 ABC transporter permease [Lachnospiraceae bacterium]MSS08765.1 ABC transporter permease [Clostridium sp. WB02_MRS01]